MISNILLILTVTLSLQDCKDSARTGNHQTRNAAIAVESAREQKAEAFLEYFPTVKLNALSFHSLNPLVSIGLTDVIGKSDAAWEINNRFNDFAAQNGLKTRYEALQNGYGAALVAVQPLYAGGRIVNGNALASLGVRAAELQQEITVRDTDAQIEERYWLVASLERKRAVLAEAISTLDAVRKDADAAIAAGVMTSGECAELDRRRRELQSSAYKLKGGIALAKMDLLNAIGMEYEMSSLDSIVLSDSLSDLPEPAAVYVPEEELRSNMQEMELLDIQVEAGQYKKKMMIGETLPQVGVGATCGYGRYLNDPCANGMLFVSVQVPLSDWGKTVHRIHRYENDVLTASNDREYYQQQLMLKVRQLWIALGIAWNELTLARAAEKDAAAEYDRTRSSHSAGTITATELLRSQLELRQAEDALTDSEIAYRKALSAYQAYQKSYR